MRALVLFFVSFLVLGCTAFRFPNINPPKPPETIYSYEQTFEKNPVSVITGENRVVVTEQQRQAVSINYEKKEKQLSWWQRFCNWLGSLGMIAFVIIVVCLFIAPGFTISFLFGRYNKFKKALKQTSRGIRELEGDEEKNIKAILSKTQDTDTKKIISVIKGELND